MSNTIVIKSQAEWDALPKSFSNFTILRIEADVKITALPESSRAVLWFAVAFATAVKRITKKSKTATIIKVPPPEWTVNGWMEREGIEAIKKKVVLFKRVSCDFRTQERTPNETKWPVGTVISHPSWKPDAKECGEGKFHACSRPYFCDEFRSIHGDRYVAIEIALVDLYSWPNPPQFPHKIAFREGKVLFECNRFGDKL